MVFIFAFFGVICLGLAPLFGKIALETVNPMFAFAVRTIIAAIFSIAWLAGSDKTVYSNTLSACFWIAIFFEAALAAFFGDLAYFYALEKGKVSEISIIMSCAPLITILFSCVVYDEVFTLCKISGAILITLGLVILNID